ncbi:hypothetical protein PPERSA_12878 [Pseudocohnilembus persalinus]|uniref:methenyltetrahydrofolate cyclohydrolase n=1 Tax=Pseudocohnilembus persalinus TaxID=266149 RepID=A0A0V0Q8B6_PSEPJ|nr:hypothetical protein PPERSA_12878 [Pseudocohnilembus persalinus]|eukprot:KRW98399.1 hypothetical protein PPERSA_12878 [Pseudocohnilembus persalinus]
MAEQSLSTKSNDYVNNLKNMSLINLSNKFQKQPFNLIKSFPEQQIQKDNIINGNKINQEILKDIKLTDLDSISIELPLPQNSPKYDFINAISPAKDIDCLQQITNFASMKQAFARSTDLIPCTPKAILYILDNYQISLFQKKVVIVGKGMLVGYPLSALLIQRLAEVQTIDEYTKDPSTYIKKADIIISAAGVRHLIKENDVKEGAIVIDVGANAPIEGDKTGIVGDVDFENVQKKAKLITPVPGGVGPVTSALYLQNVINAWKKNININRVYQPHSHFDFENNQIKTKNSN